jgi:hypothetical protein
MRQPLHDIQSGEILFNDFKEVLIPVRFLVVLPREHIDYCAQYGHPVWVRLPAHGPYALEPGDILLNVPLILWYLFQNLQDGLCLVEYLSEV